MGSPTFGRFVCVLLPFVLTAGAIVAMLVAALAGVADKGLYSFQLNTTNMTISPLDIKNILGNQISVGGVNINLDNGNVNGNINGLPVSNENGNIQVGNNNFNTNTGTGNIGGNEINTNGLLGSRDAELEVRQVPGLNVNLTTESLGLADLYDVHMWGYCYTFTKNNTRECTQPKFNWANNIFNITRNGDVATVLTQTGVNVTLPNEIVRAADVFVDVARWTQILFIISLGSLALNIIFGAAANCTRIMSCVAWLVASIAAVATIAAAGLATATAAVVVGAVESTAKFYGVGGSMNTRFLVSVWIGAACAIGAAFFFLFTICCCAPDKSRRNRRGLDEGEKLMGGSPYQPVNPGGYQGGYAGGPAAPVGRAGAYEPYSHRG